MARRRIPPMPVEALLDDPRALALPPAAYGMLCRLVHHFWLTDCRSLPAGVNDLQAIARAHISTWARHRDEIRVILRDLLPAMERDAARRKTAAGRLRDWSARGNATMAARRLERAPASIAAITTPLVGAETRQKQAAKRLVTIEEQAGRFRD